MSGVRQVALLRGINVGKAKRVAMADLRKLVEGLGYTDVRTLLNSGNVVFTAPGAARGGAAARIEKAMTARLHVPSRVTVLTEAEFAAVVKENPLERIATNPSRLLVGFLSRASDRALLKPLEKQSWKPEALAVGSRAAYLWCPEGMIESPLAKALARALGDAVTTRNWATVTKLHALAASRS